MKENNKAYLKVGVQEQLKAILESVIDGIITADEKGIIESVNPAAVRLFGYRADEMIGNNLSMLMPEPYSSEHDEYMARYLKTGQAKIIGIGRESVGLRKDGAIFPLEIAVSEMHLGKERKFVGIVRDITERRRAAEEIKKMNESLERRVAQRTKKLADVNISLQKEIQERKQAEKEVENLIKFPSENPNPLMRVAKDSTIIYANRASLPLLKACNCEIGQQLPVTLRQHINDVLRSRTNTEVELECDNRIFAFIFAPILEFGYVNLYGRDITNRKTAELQLQENEKNLQLRNKALSELAKYAAESHNEDFLDIIRKITKVASLTLGVERASIWLCNEDKSKINCLDLYELEPDRHSECLGLAVKDFPAYFQALKNERILAADEAGTDPRTRELEETHLIPYEITSKLDVLVRIGKELAAVVSFEHTGPARRWSLEEKDFAGSIGDFVAHALEEKRIREAEVRLKDYSERLEQMVEERTAKLDASLQETQKSRDRIDAIVKSVADGLIVADNQNNVILMNLAAEDMLGIRLSEAINRSLDFVIEEKSLQNWLKKFKSRKTEDYKFDFQITKGDLEHPLVLRARSSVIQDRERNQLGLVTLLQDVTQEREIDRMKTEFISTAAHELRTPLTTIQGFSEILTTRDDIPPADQKKYLSYINRQAERLANIINDLLDISRIESGKGFSLNKGPCFFCDVIERVVLYFQESSKKHQFEVSLPEKRAALVIDEEKMEQVLKNIIGNAVKYSPKGGLIRVSGECAADHLKVSVADQGIGMTPDQVKRVFDKFYRADVSNTTIPGTGLGMCIVKYLVEAHGGRVWLESVLGKGTTVWVTIPIDPKEPQMRGEK